MKKLITIIVLFISLSSIAQTKTQCKGITKAGTQCKRMVETDYCYQHAVKHDNSQTDSTSKVYIPKFKAGIVKHTTDDRGLTSVVYVDKSGNIHALDFLTKKEFQKLIAGLK